MTRYLARRLIGAVPLVLGVTTILFFVMAAAPGDSVDLLTSPSMSEETREQIRANFGYDEPVPVRYAKWLGRSLRGDLGYSVRHGRPVRDVVLAVLPNTLLLSGTALLLSFFFGVVLGTIQAIRQYSVTDSVLSVVLLFFYSMPSFWLAVMLMLTLGLYADDVWGWPVYFPISGIGAVGSEFAALSFPERLADRAWHLFLPALTLTLVITAGVARYMRSSMLEVVRQDFVRTARAKGLPERQVIFKHALRNALIPIITLLGLYLPVLFSGTVFVEAVFGWPGMGNLIVTAVGHRDYNLVMAGSLAFAVLVVLGNLLADVLYAVVDPRIRYE